MRKEKSLSRAKGSAASLGDLLLKEGITSIAPGATILYELGKLAVEHGKRYYADRTEERLENFHKFILEDHVDARVDLDEILSKKFDLDDYHALLSSCIQDIENEKTKIYANLMKFLILSNLPQEERRYYIKLTKELTYQELQFIRELYINQNYHFMTVGGPSEQVRKLLSSSAPMTNITIKSLINHGLIFEDKSGITDIATQYVRLMFVDDELTPKSINQVEYSGHNVAILNYMIGDPKHDKAAMTLHESLHRHAIKSSILTLQRNASQYAPYSVMFSSAILILDDVEYSQGHFDKEAIKAFAEKRPVFRLNIGKNSHDLTGIKINPFADFEYESTTQLAQEIDKAIEPIFSN
ncbi:hypothetical protein WMQ58_04475 [Vibrio diabolicus]|uniref:hypothetical protein n=1 Tax=Vibrio harveyi group TaxID=717610 RepID=UPI00186A01DD|nr:hypothetical protein [Vibrio alginolyticus]MBE4444334.1 hypothetical protein [Vibrio parahaemolyticus]MCG6327382.1 hypothetical protein [Vibrio alginolyticus]